MKTLDVIIHTVDGNEDHQSFTVVTELPNYEKITLPDGLTVSPIYPESIIIPPEQDGPDVFDYDYFVLKEFDYERYFKETEDCDVIYCVEDYYNDIDHLAIRNC